MIADPGERQIGERLVLGRELVERDRIGGRIDAARGRQHHALGLAGRAGCVENDRRVGAIPRGDLAVEPFAERRVFSERAAAIRNDVVDRVQLGVIVVAQAARLVVENPFKLRHGLVTGAELLTKHDKPRISPNVFRHGMNVTHPQYGAGTIIALSGDGPKRTATVRFFQDEAERKFRLIFSDLTPAENGQ